MVCFKKGNPDPVDTPKGPTGPNGGNKGPSSPYGYDEKD